MTVPLELIDEDASSVLGGTEQAARTVVNGTREPEENIQCPTEMTR